MSWLTTRHNAARSLVAAFGLLFAADALAHGGGLDADGCHVDSKTRERHCHRQSPPGHATAPPRAGDDGVLYGQAVRIIDGDTLVVKIQGVEMQFRLAEVDAPEMDQTFGEEARGQLAALVGSEQCVLVPADKDRYGRWVAQLWIGDTHVNAEMVKLGFAWFDSAYGRDASLYQLENDARNEKRGLWALPLEQRMEPWHWRRETR